ncbi:hypothetical protein TSUD_25580 [Trifolium subterraneum]|uniref:Uncharacterized protein n=1 Tax=Trifolium subterraneum TaxID=3900 RepID=A0A2Z6PDY0_TRISU|nr:hypothetical protein TSUD_25580 [Trifolium subterraneum]
MNMLLKSPTLSLNALHHPTTPFLRPFYPSTHLPLSSKLTNPLHVSKQPLMKHSISSMKCSKNLEFEPDPTLTNEDLKPTSQTQRTFSGLEIASLWIGLVVGVPSYYLAGSLVDLGTKYGISFPVLARSSFGIHGAHIPTLLRALVGCAPANALVNLNPSWFTFRRGAFLTAILGIAFQPWRLLKSSESFVYTWLVGYSALMGPIGGIVLVDYYFIKKMELRVSDLYTRSPFGAYYYSKGFNVAAIVALVVGILPVVPGFLHKVGIVSSIPNAFVVIYNNAWFISFFLAGFLYWILLRLRGKLGESNAIDPLLPNAN